MENSDKNSIKISVYNLYNWQTVNCSGGSGYPIPGIPEPDRNYFVIPEPDWNLSGQDQNRIGTGLWTGRVPGMPKGDHFYSKYGYF